MHSGDLQVVSTDSAASNLSEQSKITFQLDKICKFAQLNASSSDDDSKVDAIAKHVSATLKAQPSLLTAGPAPILQDMGELSEAQRAKVSAVEEATFKVSFIASLFACKSASNCIQNLFMLPSSAHMITISHSPLDLSPSPTLGF